MTAQRSLLGRRIGRTALALLTAGAVVLLAPVAAASPESDANDAINQAWEASGGAGGSTLGEKQGGVYPIGGGFGQNFAGGRIFFSPDTGAKRIGGAILDKYESLGGPADSDLGFPTIDEGPGRVSPESRNTTFSASDKPVIFWTPSTGAWVVRGAINVAWDKLGGSAGILGVPVEDESYERDVVSQKFSGGELSWNTRTRAYTTVPPELATSLSGLQVPSDATTAINAAWRASGGVSGPLGARQGAQYAIGDDGVGQNFAGGKIFFTPATGANIVAGAILAKYESLGGPGRSDLGFPTANEADGGVAPASRISTFAAPDQPVIFFTPDRGAVVVRGAINAAWGRLGGPTGQLGVPLGDQTVDGDTVTQKFSGGEISWNSTTNSFTTTPRNLGSALSGLQVPGQENSPTASASNADGGNGFTWQRWWLWILIPVVVALGALAAGGWWRRRRARDAKATLDAEPVLNTVAAYESVPAADRNWSPDTDIDADTSRFSEHDVEMSGYPSSGMGLADPEIHRPAATWAGGTDTADVLLAEEAAGGTYATDVPDDLDEGFDVEDPDAVDTTPTRIQPDPDANSGRHAAVNVEEPQDVWTAVDDEANLPHGIAAGYAPSPVLDTAAAGTGSDTYGDSAAPFTAIHLPLDDPDEAPYGYPIKAIVRTGVYHTPDSASYADVIAEIWFASEELARANGFAKGR